MSGLVLGMPGLASIQVKAWPAYLSSSLSSSRRFPVPKHLFANVPNDPLYLSTMGSRGKGSLKHIISDTAFWEKGTVPMTSCLSYGRHLPKCVLQDAGVCQMVTFTTLTKHTKKGFAREITCGTLGIKNRWFLFCLFICCKTFKLFIPTLHCGSLRGGRKDYVVFSSRMAQPRISRVAPLISVFWKSDKQSSSSLAHYSHPYCSIWSSPEFMLGYSSYHGGRFHRNQQKCAEARVLFSLPQSSPGEDLGCVQHKTGAMGPPDILKYCQCHS